MPGWNITGGSNPAIQIAVIPAILILPRSAAVSSRPAAARLRKSRRWACSCAAADASHTAALRKMRIAAVLLVRAPGSTEPVRRHLRHTAFSSRWGLRCRASHFSVARVAARDEKVLVTRRGRNVNVLVPGEVWAARQRRPTDGSCFMVPMHASTRKKAPQEPADGRAPPPHSSLRKTRPFGRDIAAGRNAFTPFPDSRVLLTLSGQR